MAKYFLLVKVFSRGRGSRVTRAAAYRAGERMRDERTSESYNYSDRRDIVHSEIVLPSNLANRAGMEWAYDRCTLWNAVESAGQRVNSRLAREVLVTLPPELTPAQRTRLVRTFARELADKYRNAVDFAVHEPRKGSDMRHHHAHVLMTAREITPEGMGPRTTLELSGTERHARGLGSSREDLLSIRTRWAQLTNEALAEAGLAERVDHRSYAAQGVDRDPAVAMPQKAFYAEKKSGHNTAAGDDIRARHRERVEARSKGPEEFARVLKKQKDEARERAVQAAKEQQRLPRKIRHAMLTRDQRNELRRQEYSTDKDAINAKRRERSRQLVQVNGQVKSRAEIRNQSRREEFRALSEAEREVRREKARAQYRERVAAKQAYATSVAQTPNSSAIHTPEESIKNWLAYRESQGHQPTAEQSAQNWLAYRESQQQENQSKPESTNRKTDHTDGNEDRSDREVPRDHDASL